MASLREDNLAATLADLRLMSAVADDSGKTLLFSDPNQIAVPLGQCEVFHPVVALEASLWELAESSVVEAPWFRLEQIDAYGVSQWWCDVVNADYLEQYVTRITEHYDEAYRAAGATPYSPSSQELR